MTAVVFPGQQNQQAVSNDPLFDALAKYVATSPGASSTSKTKVSELLENYGKKQGGHAYIESITSPQQTPSSRMWQNSSPATGWIHTDTHQLNLTFTATKEYVTATGSDDGLNFYPNQGATFSRATFFWDELDTSKEDVKVKFEIFADLQWQHTSIRFYSESATEFNESNLVGEVIAYDQTFTLPPAGIMGTATLSSTVAA